MKLYSDYGARRTRQILGDLVAVALIGLWVWFGVGVFQLVDGLAEYGQGMVDAGSGIEESMNDVGEQLGGVPLIGGGIRAPFDAASEAGTVLVEAGLAQQEAVHRLALGLGVGISTLPILTILLLWLVPRIRFVRSAARAQEAVGTAAGLDLLALRALATQKLAAVTEVAPDALEAWRRGDPAVTRRLAELELRSAGVRLRE